MPEETQDIGVETTRPGSPAPHAERRDPAAPLKPDPSPPYLPGRARGFLTSPTVMPLSETTQDRDESRETRDTPSQYGASASIVERRDPTAPLRPDLTATFPPGRGEGIFALTVDLPLSGARQDRGGAEDGGAGPLQSGTATPHAERRDSAAALKPDLPPPPARQIALTVADLREGQTEIRLSPEELGRVRLTVASAEGAVSIQIVADRPETAEQLRRSADQLARDLSDLGYRSVDVEVRGDGDNGSDGRGRDGARPAQGDPAGAIRDKAIDSLPAPAATGRSSAGSAHLDLRL
ncbi:flagellar hook-length control protein FliK [Wenxinia marina]|nr:flagellar hook-length control protein FliK [Wenxinia marina]